MLLILRNLRIVMFMGIGVAQEILIALLNNFRKSDLFIFSIFNEIKIADYK